MYYACSLYDYFFEDNNGFVDIMESDRGPVLMTDVLNSTYTVYYYIPTKYQDGGIPDPVDPDVVQVTLPKSRYAAVRRVDGEIIDKLVLSQVDVLRNNLKRTNYKWAMDPHQFTYVMYNQQNWVEGYEILIWLN